PEVQAHGCAVRPRFVTPELVSEIVSYFQDQPGDAIGEEFRRTRYARLAGLDRGLKFEYDTSVTVRAPHVLEILTDDALVGAAFHYLRSEPIFAGVKAW